MSKSVIFDKVVGKLSNLKNSDYYLSKITHSAYKAVLSTLGNQTRLIKTTDHSLSSVSYSKVNATPESVLPFRIKITNIGVEGYGPGNPPPIGIAVIGINNYIL